MFAACEEEDKAVIGDEVIPPQMTSPSDGASIVVSETNMADELIITWEEADYGVDLAVTYTVEMDIKDNVFYAPAIVASTQENTATVTIEAINTMIISDLHQQANERSDVEFRVVATTEGLDDLTSPVVAGTVTTFQSAGDPAVVTTPAVGAESTITVANLMDKFSVEWSPADLGTSDVVYTVELVVGDASVVLGKTGETKLAVNNESLNYYLVGNLEQAGGAAVTASLQVTASSSTTDLKSELSSVVVNTLDATVPGRLYVPGGYQNWVPDVAPTLNQSGDIFDGFVYMNIETGFKFTSAPDWDHTNFGFDSEGVLTKDGDAAGLTYGPGFFRYQVDTVNLTYVASLVESFGLIGTATPGAWDSSTPMTYDEATDTWRATADLVVGALKFRANDAWDINYGVADITSLRGQLYFDGGSYDVKEDGNYTVILSFDTQKTPYQFNYEIIKN
ncbi:hypothetical protein BFP72_00410 [Reichenbachiella sp. 5M10]|nr:hypothetical protein BFP72_00410 [Reichenbachiella sp. 5M10]